MNKKLTTKWYQMCIEDEQFLSGSSVSRFIETLTSDEKKLTIRISNAEGAFSANLFDSNQIYKNQEFIEIIRNISQFDWADLFLGSQTIDNSIVLERNENTFSNFDLVLSLADSTYFYVYCRNVELLKKLVEQYPNTEIKHCEFKDLQFMN